TPITTRGSSMRCAAATPRPRAWRCRCISNGCATGCEAAPPVRRVLVNTDTSAGDALALLLLLGMPDVQVEGVAITCGNSEFDQQVENALYTIELAGRGGEVPVYPGCREPLLGRYRSVPEVWGADGMGDSRLPRATQRAEPRHAVDAIIELAARHADELEIVSLGPLTNLAVALRQQPNLARQVRAIYAMGGCLYAQGNITLGAEYNAWVDPEAAQIVFRAGANLVLIPWEVAAREAFVAPDEEGGIAWLYKAGRPVYLEVTPVT